MSVSELLLLLAQRGIQLWAEGERLRYRAPEGALTAELRGLLAQHKPEVLARLAQGDAAWPPSAPLSYGQRALWFLHQAAPDSPAYHVGYAARVRSALDQDALRRACQALLDRHATLRSTFPLQDGRPVQRIQAQAELAFSAVDAAGWDEPALRAAVAAAYQAPFDLQRGPLLRVALFSRAPDEHVLLLTVHHIAADGWSTWQLLDELRALYPAELAGRPAVLAPLQAQYTDYLRWQEALVASPLGQAQRGYWQRRLAGPLPPLSLPADRPRPASMRFRGASCPLDLGPALSRRVAAFARARGATAFTVLLAAFQALLGRASGQEDVLVGTPTFGRPAEFAQVVGDFVNTVVLRADLSGDPSFGALVEQARAATLEALENADYPFVRLVEQLQPQRDPARTPVFQALFALQRDQRSADLVQSLRPGAAPRPLDFGGLRLEPFGLAQQEGQFDLTLELFESEGELFGALKYCPDLLEPETAARMAGHYRTLLAAALDAPERPLSRLELLSPAERRQILVEWNSARLELPAGACLHTLFEQQARRTPDAAALVYEPAAGAADPRPQRLSYRELNARANRLAHHLRGLGVGPETLVGLCLQRTPALLVGLLAVLKAGGAYVPLDPAYPRERLAWIMEDARAPLLLTQRSLAAELPAGAARVLALDEAEAGLADQPAHDPAAPAAPANLVYVLYTSGSTGRPKGVAIEHRSAVAMVAWARRLFPAEDLAAVLAATSVCFDLSVFELFAPWSSGGAVYLAQNALHLPTMRARDEISLINTVPSAMAELLRSGALPARLRTVNLAGEPLPRELARRIAAATPARLFNLYGPSEDTTYSTWALVDPAEDMPPPIGRPLDNSQVYILDRHLAPVPRGAVGEIYIAGAGLARGYLGRPDLTAEKFAPNPFAGGDRVSGIGYAHESPDPLPDTLSPGGRLYKTGDLGRHRPDGQIEFLGRIDHQVKLRGFRIELGEIEAALRAHPAVREALVLAREDTPGDQRLVAYLVLADQGRTTNDEAPGATQPDIVLRPPSFVEELRAHLAQTLPSYMVPGAFVELAALPLTPNGKVDRKALPTPRRAEPAPQVQAEPRSELERLIAQIWREVLGLEQIGVGQNFFDLGGHSLLLAEVSHRLRAALPDTPPLIELFNYPTVRSLAARLARPPAAEQPPPAAPAPAPAPAERAVAVIGMAGRFPGAPDLARFWANLRDGVESISFFSQEELREAGVAPELIGRPDFVPAGGVIEGVELFDAGLFGITPREAELLDPQQRLFLECAWEALEHAGYAPAGAALPVGVFAGAGMNTYLANHLQPGAHLLGSPEGFPAVIGNDKDFLASRVSYKLNLEGPSVVVQTACSTSLVAVHLACQSLLAGECAMALAGGSSVVLPQKAGYLYQQDSIVSPDGHCRAFDAEGRGSVVGNGVGLVLLKPLAAALRDGDTIYAVIRGSAINNDGATKVGYTAPRVEGQAAVIQAAQQAAGVAPASLAYIETHGTGTALGDPIEVAALTRVFAPAGAPPGSCALGSVKTNIGHLNAAAGVAGLIKTVLALHHAQIPPSLHFQRPNPQIDFERLPFYVNTALRDWPDTGGPRRAGVSSFGIGGTNVHVVLEQAPAPQPDDPGRPWQLLTLSARSPQALERASAALLEDLRQHPQRPLADVAFTLQVGRHAFAQRQVLVCRDHADALAALEARDPARLLGAAAADRERPVAFLFPGLGDQYVNLARGLYEGEPLFRATVDRCCDLLTPLLGQDLRAVLYPAQAAAPEPAPAPAPRLDLRALLGRGGAAPDPQAARLQRTELAQPALFVIEYALAQLWMAWGVRPSALIGYSLGEYVAACLAGVFSLEDGLRLVARRAQLIQALPEGAMLAVALPEPEARALLEGPLCLAALNGPQMSVLAGPAEPIAALERRLLDQGVSCRRLQTTHAFHSTMLAPAAAELTALVASFALAAPRIPYLSNVTGDWITPEQATDPAYWARHMVETVRFADGLAALCREPERVFVEVGPGQTLGSLVAQHPASAQLRERVAVPSLRQQHDRRADQAVLLGSLGQLWLAGLAPDWAGVYAQQRRRRVALPTYPFERQRYWVEPRHTAAAAPAAGGRAALDDWFHLPIWRQAPLLGAAPAAEADGAWLVFDDGGSLAARLAERLAGAGRTLLRVQPGPGYARLDQAAYTLDPADPAGYGALLDDLRARGLTPRRVLHLWAAADPRACAPEQVLERGLYSLLFLAQALGERLPDAPLALDLVVAHMAAVTGQEDPHPEQATLLGPARVIPLEYPAVRCRTIDILPPAPGAPEEQRLAELLAAELASRPDAPLVALRGRQRWLQSYEPVRLPARPDARPPLRQGGVYLITGGLGGVGLALARHLAERYGARLVLVGRTALPARDTWDAWLAAAAPDDPRAAAARQIQAIERAGGAVLALGADVTDPQAVRAALEQARRRFGPVNGLFHLAGVLDDGAIQLKTRAAVARVLAPKLRGTRVLEELLLGQPELELAVLFSSLASVLGNTGQVDYTAANAFLDAFAQRAALRGGPRVLSVNWDTWADAGMAARSADGASRDGLRQQLAAFVEQGMRAEEGIEALLRILAGPPEPQVAVSTRDLRALEQILARSARALAGAASAGAGETERPAAGGRQPRPALRVAYTPPRDEFEHKIAAVWEEVLGIAPVGIHDNFFDLGGNSLIGIQVAARLRALFAAPLSLPMLLAAPSVAQVAAALEELFIADLEQSDTLG